MRNPTDKKLRRAGFTVVRWYSRGMHSQNQIGWITEEREVPGRGKKRRTECRVEFVSDRTRWIDKSELTLLTPERATELAKSKAEREEHQRDLDAKRHARLNPDQVQEGLATEEIPA